MPPEPESWTIRHFSQANPVGPGQDSVPALLRRIADSIEQRPGIEPNGYLGTLDEVIVPLPRGTRLVSHFRNGNAVDHFFWLDDGVLRLHFEPLFPAQRDGSDPTAWWR